MVPGRQNQSIDLVERARAGESDAVAELLAIYRNYLLLLARVHIDTNLQSKADPSDLVQETCLMAARDLPHFRGETEAEFVGWLRKILANAAATMIRRYKGTQGRAIGRERQFGNELDRSSAALESLVSSPTDSPSRIASRRERAVVLADALSRMPSDYSEVLVLFHLEGLKLSEVADRMGRSVASVRGLRTRAVMKLRSLMLESK